MPTDRQRTYWSMPTCAWHRRLGDYPASTDVIDVAGCYDTQARPKKGIPLGGIGAGTFMYNLCGSFGPWHFKPGRYEERFLTQAAFHVREQVQGKPAQARTLATDDVLPAWPRLNIGDGNY
jgi:non-lysosomal glucosylceramidase